MTSRSASVDGNKMSRECNEYTKGSTEQVRAGESRQAAGEEEEEERRGINEVSVEKYEREELLTGVSQTPVKST